jgi:ferredoxin
VVVPVHSLNKACPVCGNQGPELLTCNDCGALVASCPEEGTMFPSPHDLSHRVPYNYDMHNTRCPRCHTAKPLRPASVDEIRSAGLSESSYQ